MVMDGSASLGLILHEVGHNYTMGILANNEWKEGYLDEGFTSFQTNWYFQTHGNPEAWKRDFEATAELDARGISQPLDLPAAAFRDFDTYNAMTYTKPSVVYRMLQAYLGDATFRKGLRLYYERNRLRHVTLADFRSAMEEASGQDLGWFFDEWFHTTKTLDYAVTGATAERQADGSWLTTVEVTRRGEAWMPVTVRAGGSSQRLEGHEPTQRLRFVTPERPSEVVVDPDEVVVDVDRSNNRRSL
jgi:aminopeptidase N